MTQLLAVVALAALFVVFGVGQRGARRQGCGSCPGEGSDEPTCGACPNERTR